MDWDRKNGARPYLLHICCPWCLRPVGFALLGFSKTGVVASCVGVSFTQMYAKDRAVGWGMVQYSKSQTVRQGSIRSFRGDNISDNYKGKFSTFSICGPARGLSGRAYINNYQSQQKSQSLGSMP